MARHAILYYRRIIKTEENFKMDILREIEGNKILCKYFTLIGFKLNILRDNK